MQEAVIREIQQLRLLMGSSRDPRGRVFAQLADALRRGGDLDEAWDVVRDGVESDPHFSPGHLVMGWVLQERGEADGALRAYRKTVDLDPDNPFALYGAGVLLRARGDGDGAELVDRARELHATVDALSPQAPEPVVPLHELPFLPLAELAPESDAELPFMALAELAPESGAELPFMALPELAPDEPAALPQDRDAHGAALESLPFVSLLELAPDAARDPEDRDAGQEGVVEPGRDGEVPEESDDAIPATRTMAELLVSQGQVDRAVDIYGQILEREPGNRDVEARIAELRESLHPELSAGQSPAESGPSPFTWLDDGDEDDGAPGAAAEGQEPSLRQGTASAASYFGDLLSFTPGRSGDGPGELEEPSRDTPSESPS